MSNETNPQRRQYLATQKAAILREHFLEKVPVSTLCDKYGLNPTMFYRWQQEFFERGVRAFETKTRREGPTLEQRVKTLQAKLVRKDEVIAELMEEHLKLKKNLGQI